jgi:SAM-dependent methyltransferase
MLDAAAVGPGTRLLDAGSGAGGASALAAGRGALVNGLDAAAALLAIARERVPDGDFQVGELEALPYGDSIFDAIVAANVVQYVTDPLTALRELRRVSATGGRVAVAVCTGPEECEQHAIIAAVQDLLPAPLGVLECPLSGPGALEVLVAQAGLAIRGGAIVSCPCMYPDRETAVQAQMSAGPFQAAQRLTGEQSLRATVLRALAPYETSTGAVCVCSRSRYVVASPDGDRRPPG